jgi:hypothetical protein
MLHSLNSLPSSDFNPSLNFLCEENPFGLASPPNWFLEEMWKFDPCLVIFPSKEEAIYRMARRVEHGQAILTLVADPARRRPDTTMFWKHRLVPVTSILPSPFVHWSPVLLKDLAERDIRRQGGYKKVADRLDAEDEKREAQWSSGVEDGATIRARASWREQKWTRGESLDLGARKPEGARTTKDRTLFGPSTRRRLPSGDATSMALFTGRDATLQGARPFLDADADMKTLIVRAV